MAAAAQVATAFGLGTETDLSKTTPTVTGSVNAYGSALIGVYFAKSTIASSFGAAGGFAVYLAWVYYSAQIFFFGAELTQVIASRRKCGRMLSPLVEAPSLRPEVVARDPEE